jgi:hypothetical protein
MQLTRENYRMMRERLLRIIYWKSEDGGKPPANRDVNEAAQEHRHDPTSRSRRRHVQEAARSPCQGSPLRAAARRSPHCRYRGMDAWGIPPRPNAELLVRRILDGPAVDAVIEQAVVIKAREDEAQRRRDWAKTCENASSFKPDR